MSAGIEIKVQSRDQRSPSVLERGRSRAWPPCTSLLFRRLKFIIGIIFSLLSVKNIEASFHGRLSVT